MGYMNYIWKENKYENLELITFNALVENNLMHKFDEDIHKYYFSLFGSERYYLDMSRLRIGSARALGYPDMKTIYEDESEDLKKVIKHSEIKDERKLAKKFLKQRKKALKQIKKESKK